MGKTRKKNILLDVIILFIVFAVVVVAAFISPKLKSEKLHRLFEKEGFSFTVNNNKYFDGVKDGSEYGKEALMEYIHEIGENSNIDSSDFTLRSWGIFAHIEIADGLESNIIEGVYFIVPVGSSEVYNIISQTNMKVVRSGIHLFVLEVEDSRLPEAFQRILKKLGGKTQMNFDSSKNN